MRSLEDLLIEPDAWPTLQGWIREARDAQAVAPPGERRGDVLTSLQVTTRSMLGVLAWHTAGLVVAGGWLRHLGGGGLRDWNASLGGAPLDPPLGGALIVALDAIGGIFAINSGGLPGDAGLMHYFAPDTQSWMPLEMGHSAFVQWSLSAQLDQFYADLRWSGWQAEVAGLKADEVMNFYPPLGFETTPLDKRSRRPVPGRENWGFLNEIARQTAELPEGTPIRFTFDRP